MTELWKSIMGELLVVVLGAVGTLLGSLFTVLIIRPAKDVKEKVNKLYAKYEEDNSPKVLKLESQLAEMRQEKRDREKEEFHKLEAMLSSIKIDLQEKVYPIVQTTEILKDKQEKLEKKVESMEETHREILEQVVNQGKLIGKIVENNKRS